MKTKHTPEKCGTCNGELSDFTMDFGRGDKRSGKMCIGCLSKPVGFKTMPADKANMHDELVAMLEKVCSVHGNCICNNEQECTSPTGGCLGDLLHSEIMSAKELLAKAKGQEDE